MNPIILAVDDTTESLALLRSLLSAADYNVRLADSAELGLAAAAASAPDLILLDIRMPGMDGLEMCRQLQTREETCNIPIILMSAFDEDKDWVAGLNAGAVDYISKPIRTDELLSRVRTHLKLSHTKKLEKEALSLRQAKIDLESEILLRRQAEAELEQRVQERTAMLETANQELEAFSYSVSHDLRAPIRAIQGFGSILQEDFAPSLEPEMVRILNVIISEALRMGQLIDALLNFSRLNRLPLKQEIVSSKELVSKALALLQDAQAGRSVEITVGELPSTMGDSVLLLQVWVNLLSNALKYTNPRPVSKIWISGQQEGSEVIYFVKDNGVGFDMKYADKLFGVFQRLHTKDEFEGVGIGLSLIQRIVLRHGGRVWAESQVNEGATFYFALPNPKEK